jgi:hypothetical protein
MKINTSNNEHEIEAKKFEECAECYYNKQERLNLIKQGYAKALNKVVEELIKIYNSSNHVRFSENIGQFIMDKEKEIAKLNHSQQTSPPTSTPLGENGRGKIRDNYKVHQIPDNTSKSADTHIRKEKKK